ncbi:MAG: dockerin type I domain-containing protein [Sedimentisphaeraceae bacterium JB056]
MRSQYRLMLAVFFLAGFATVKAENEVTKWNELTLQIIKEAVVSPPKTSRDLAIVHTSIYDSVNSIEQTYTPIYAPWQPDAESLNKDVAIAAAAHRALSLLYPAFQTTLDTALTETINAQTSQDYITESLALGENVADIIIAWRNTDGWDSESDYTYDDTTLGKWRPTPPNYAPPLEPQWGDVEPFAIDDANNFMPPAPPALTSPEYAVALNEVKDLGAIDSTTRTADQDEIAEFWNDFPGNTAAPAGKWNSITQEVITQFNLSLIETARLFALLNLSLADAGTVSWKAKYEYDLWRPIDAIRLADTEGNPYTTADLDWEPNWPTPPFPEYVSGHSTFSSSGAKMLELILGTNQISFTISAGFDVLPGVTRSYTSLWQAAEEAGMSRIYGGIHFQFGNIEGLNCGENISIDVHDNWCLDKPCDLNRDASIDYSDIIHMGTEWLAINDRNDKVFSDINYDGQVDYIDFILLSKKLQWQVNTTDLKENTIVSQKEISKLSDDLLTNEPAIIGDINSDNIVNIADYSIFAQNWLSDSSAALIV